MDLLHGGCNHIHNTLMGSLHPQWSYTRSAKANGREHKSCLGRVFNFKLGCFVMCTIGWHIQARPSQEWKTWPRFHPVSLSLPMTYIMAAVTIDLIICKLDHYNMVGVTDYGKQSSLFQCRIKCRRKKCYKLRLQMEKS